MHAHTPARTIFAVALVTAAALAHLSAQDAAPPPAASAVSPARPGSPPPPPVSRGANEIIKLLEAGVSKDVIKTYVETSPTLPKPTAADIIALKEHGVSDDIMTALLKRTPDARPNLPSPGAPNPPPSQQQQDMAGPVSPPDAAPAPPPVSYYDSYDYFQRYYLLPRTLANVNQTLGYSVVSPYAYAYPYPYAPVFYGPSFSVGIGVGRPVVGRPFRGGPGPFRR